VAVTDDAESRGSKTIWNTYGILRGTEFPEEMVIIGAHRDAWGAGAVDNVSGTVSVLEAARALAEQSRRGVRPKRTVVFATWDAEEWGLIGSTEYVEDDSLRLMRGAVAYLNQDVSASGSRFGAGGSPSLRPTLRDIVRQVPHPLAGTSVYAEWRRASAVADSAEPRMGDPGGGSDFAGFYNPLGIPHSDWGFGGPGGIYHSAYDTHRWMTTFGDTNHAHHAASASIGAAMLLRLANADVLPYDYVEFARTMRSHLGSIERGTARWERVSATQLRAAIDRMEEAAAEFAATRDAALAGGVKRPARQAANRALLRVERALTRPEGLRTRPWYRNLIYAADENNGYSNVVFPSISEAIRGGDQALVEREIADLAERFDAASGALRDARRALGAR
jgi:N-acetylated-alpha-linked acidic dipeptidase